MKLNIYILGIIIFVFGLGTSYGQDIYEPNDTYETAAPVSCGDEITAYIQVDGDIDWYEIVMGESGVLEVAVTSVPDDIRMNLEIYQVIDNVLTLIADDRINAGYGDNVFTNAVINAGTFLVKVHDQWNSASSDTDPYEMALTCTPNALELNQIYEEAASIPADTCFEENIYGDNRTYTVYNDVDWFEIQLTSSGVLEISTTSVPDNLRLNVEIYQLIENVLTIIADDRVNSGYGDDVFTNAVVNPGTYLIKVHDQWDANFNEDTFSFCSKFTPNALELNQIYEEAASIPADTCFEENIYGDNHTYTVYNDVDWFEIQLTSSGVLEISTTSVPDNLRLNVEIYQLIENVLTLIADDRVNSGYGDDVFTNAVVNPGTYLIKVHDQWDANFNEDTFSFCSKFTPNALELNQIYEEAAAISLDTCFEANIYGDNKTYTVFNDVDWFSLEVLENGYDLEIAITSVPDNLRLNLEVHQLIDNVLTLIADDGGNAGYGDNVFISTVVDAGTYLIKVHDQWDANYNEDNYQFCLGTTSIDEQDLSAQFQVFPNPSNGQFTIQKMDNDIKLLSISLYDQMGREYLNLSDSQLESKSIRIDPQLNATGIFFLRIQTSNGLVVKKLLVQ